MVSRIESIGCISDLRSVTAIGSAKNCRPMMEMVIVDRKFSMAHALREIATRLSVDNGKYLKISLALNS